MQARNPPQSPQSSFAYYDRQPQMQNQQQQRTQGDPIQTKSPQRNGTQMLANQGGEMGDFIVINPDGKTYFLKIIGEGTIKLTGQALQEPKIIPLGTQRI